MCDISRYFTSADPALDPNAWPPRMRAPEDFDPNATFMVLRVASAATPRGLLEALASDIDGCITDNLH